MRFGIILPTYLSQASVSGVRQVALQAETLGYDSVWTTDHVMMPRNTTAPYTSIYECLNLMAWLAGITQRVKLGVSVLIMPQRHPIVVAKEVATLDALSNGRIILGLGAGWAEEEFGYLNADFHHRGAILDEGIGVLRSLWRTPDAPFQGTYFRFEGQSFSPPPVQPGGPPIWVGGSSPAALRRAATLADAWHGTRLPLEDVRRAAETVRSLSGDRKVEITLRGGASIPPAGESSSASVERWRKEVNDFQEAGCSEMLLNFWQGDLEDQLRLADLFAREVKPAFQT